MAISKSRKVRVGAVALATIGLVAAGTGAWAYTATGSLSGSGSGDISTVGCSADIYATTANDYAFTQEHSSNTCTSVTVKVYYHNPSGFAGWSNVVSHASKATKTLTGSDELDNSYHTAVS